MCAMLRGNIGFRTSTIRSNTRSCSVGSCGSSVLCLVCGGISSRRVRCSPAAGYSSCGRHRSSSVRIAGTWRWPPALPLYVALNWDLLGVAALVGALFAVRRRRDGLGAVLLAAAVWLKLFPIVFVPLILLERLCQRRWRDAAWFGGLFAAISIAINIPVAVGFGPAGVQLRAGWLYFFRFNQLRPIEPNFWSLFADWHLTIAQINRASALLVIAGWAIIGALFGWRRWSGARSSAALLVPAGLASLAWWFCINKVYSPQYDHWC